MKKGLIVLGSTFGAVVTCIALEEHRKQKAYKEAAEYYCKGNFVKARGIFRSLGDYKNSEEYIKLCTKGLENQIKFYDLTKEE